jgi:hypothetical protein
MRWSVYAALEEEQLDEWQLCVEGPEKSYGTCAGRRDGLATLRRKRNSLTSGSCTLWDGKEATSMVGLLGEDMVGLCSIGRGTAGRVGNCTLRDGKEAMVRVLGDEMVCVGRGTAGRRAIVR